VRLGPAFTRGAVLVSGAVAIQYALSFLTIAILARFLTPVEFGQAVLALTLADLLMVVASLSLPAALLRESEEAFPAAFSAALALEGIILAVAFVVAIGVAAILWILADTVTAGIFLAVMGARAFGLIANHYQAIVERRLAYGRFAVIQLGSQVASLGAAVAVAALGGGAWALATRDIVTALAMFVLALAITRYRLSRRVDPAKMRELWRFGTAMVGSRLGDVAFHRLDNLAVAVFSGSGALGLYNQAYLLAEAGNKLFAPVIAYLPLNLYAKIQGQMERVQRVYDLLSFWMTRMVAPIGVVFVVAPEQLLVTVFGDQWAPAAGMLRGLAVYTVLLPVFEHARVLLVANGAVRSVLVARGIQLGVFIPTLILLTWQYGGEGAGASVAVAMATGTIAILLRARHFAELRTPDWLPAVASAAIAAAAGGVVLAALDLAAGYELLAVTAAVLLAYTLSTVALEGRHTLASARMLAEAIRAGRRRNGTPTPEVWEGAEQ
jgi:O-antigen/teichoic acid export membrane protein